MTQNINKSPDQELSELLGEKYSSLPADKKEQLTKLYEKKRKTDIIYVFWFFSLHYAYVGKWDKFFWFMITFCGLFIWWLIDLFRLPTILRQYNEAKANELFNQINKV